MQLRKGEDLMLSIIIVAYKNGEILQKTLNSIYEYNDIGDELETIVVDNSPENEKVDRYVNNSYLKNTKYIKASNRGFGASNNIGAKEASGDIIAFINPDIIFIEPIFSKIISYFESEKNTVWIGCKLLSGDMKPNYSFFNDYEDSLIKKIRLSTYVKKDLYDKNNMCLSGSNIFIRKDIFKIVGMFDENIFMFCEELDLKMRIRQKCERYDFVYLPNLRMIHLEGRNVNQNYLPSRFFNELKSCKYVSQKYHLNFKKKLRYHKRILLIKEILSFFNRNKADLYQQLISICNEYEKDLN